jgi:superfamily II RNA helicase
MSERRMELYPEQEEAVLELFAGSNVILATPTGSGKSLVAAALHFKELCAHAPAAPRRSVYTCPIKALVNEKFLALCRDFGPENVGMMTGDASVNPHAPVLCCTAEILANIALGGGPRADAVSAVIMDEFHYYSDPERGVAWQVPLLTLPRARFLLMSATLGDTSFIERELTRLTGAPAVTIRGDRRPVPLEFEYSETPLNERVADLLATRRAPVYLVYFTQREASEAAQDLTSLAVCTRDEKAALAAALEAVRFNSPYGRDMKRWLRHGIGVHHAGLLPRYRILVEQLAQRGLLKLICGTDTLGVGINVPIRTVVFTKLWKYDGQKAAILNVRDFRQIAGRAGRKGFDTVGHVVVQAPEHIIANKLAEAKAAAAKSSGGKKKTPAKQKAPEGTPGWDAKTFEKLMTAPPEPLQSRFAVSHGMLLHVLGRDADGCRVMRRLIADSHEPPARKKAHRRRAWQLFRSLLDRRIIEWMQPPAPTGRKLRVNAGLQDDFSLHQALSLYLIDTLPLLDRASPDYAFDVLTLCESIVEDPDTILRRQLDRLKTDELARMKAADIPYEERMAKLEELEHPKPLRDFLYDTFNRFAAAHPWVENENVRPKSIAREMYERYQSFSAYVREYGLERSEGLLLRHLSQTYKVLAQTVPDTAKTEEVLEMETWFRELIQGIDSSLLEEWERLRDPDYVAPEAASDKPARPSNYDLTRDAASFRRQVRAAILSFLQDIAARDYDSAAEKCGIGEPAAPSAVGPDLASGRENENPSATHGATQGRALQMPVPPARRLEALFAPYFEARARFRLDPEGRAANHTHWLEDEAALRARDTAELHLAQVLIDPDGQNDWEARFTLDLSATRAAAHPVLSLETVTPL